MRSLIVAVVFIGYLGLAKGKLTSFLLFLSGFLEKFYFFKLWISAGCDNPKVQASSYTSTDAQILTHIPFIAEFTLTCSNGEASIPLYASINGALSE